jgi:hypothetical protein
MLLNDYVILYTVHAVWHRVTRNVNLYFLDSYGLDGQSSILGQGK